MHYEEFKLDDGRVCRFYTEHCSKNWQDKPQVCAVLVVLKPNGQKEHYSGTSFRPGESVEEAIGELLESVWVQCVAQAFDPAAQAEGEALCKALHAHLGFTYAGDKLHVEDHQMELPL